MIINKKLIRKLIPKQVARYLDNYRRGRRFRGKSSKQIFDQVYQEAFWGVDEKRDPISGEGSHDDKLVIPYVKAVKFFLESQDFSVVVDLGCGDFNIGYQLAGEVKNYLACDVSQYIIDVNRKKFNLEGLEFRSLDLAKDALPHGDIGIIRQVLQHLSNEDIYSFVESLNTLKPYRFLIVSEHVPLKANFTPNLQKKTGPGVRVEIESGVVLDVDPFKLEFLSKKVLVRTRADVGSIPAEILTTCYQLKK